MARTFSDRCWVFLWCICESYSLCFVESLREAAVSPLFTILTTLLDTRLHQLLPPLQFSRNATLQARQVLCFEYIPKDLWYFVDVQSAAASAFCMYCVCARTFQVLSLLCVVSPCRARVCACRRAARPLRLFLQVMLVCLCRFVACTCALTRFGCVTAVVLGSCLSFMSFFRRHAS